MIGGGSAPRGPAHARNAGAAAASADLLLFIDADVIVHPDALALLVDALERDRAVAAFGSYDDRPRSRRATSLYANLRHHYVHQHSRRAATTFWSGLGLIDREAFLAAGGFDARRYPVPSIEDVELGARLIAGGHRIRLVPEAQGTHCKDWRLGMLWRTDIVRRAAPWARLIADGGTRGADLNLSRSERLKAVAAGLTAAGVVVAPLWPVTLFVSAGAAAAYLLLNARFLTFLARRVPLPALAVATLLHAAYHIYAAATFVGVTLWLRLRSRRAPMEIR